MNWVVVRVSHKLVIAMNSWIVHWIIKILCCLNQNKIIEQLFVHRTMDIRLWLLLSAIAFVCAYKECPKVCYCDLDEKGRIQTICNRGGMSSIPIIEMDPNTEVLIIRGPRNDLTIGPIFLPLEKLEILRITDSNLPSVGTYSFWGTDRLRILGKYIFPPFFATT